MALQLKNGSGGQNDKPLNEVENKATDFGGEFEGKIDSSDPLSKYRGGYGDGKIDAEKINDLPAYTGPTYIPSDNAGVNSNKKTRNIIVYSIFAVILILIGVVIVKTARNLTSSGGKDISENLTLSEEELSKKMSVQFSDNPNASKRIPQYSTGAVTVKSGNGLDVIYIDGKQVGISTASRDYRFFGIGINDPEKTVESKMTYVFEDEFIVLDDALYGQSDTTYYYNEKNNDCFALTFNKNTARVVCMTYYTNYKRITETVD
ncbi:MAG: hypothetical protein K6E10_01035 [Eubacterium sp.]|nr:hypothetical protein [Eubacterium sp.]